MKKFIFYVGVYAICATIHDIISEPEYIMTTVKGIARDCRQIVDIANGKEIKEESEVGFRPKKVMNKIGF